MKRVIFALFFIAGCSTPEKEAQRPAPASPQTADENQDIYFIAPGDTLAKIAMKFGLRIDEIMALNPDIQPAKLKVGQRLKIKKAPNHPSETTRGK